MTNKTATESAQEEAADGNLCVVIIDERHFEKLYALRMEQFFVPNDDGSPSMNFKIVYHTQWWLFRDNQKVGERWGPQIVRTAADLLPRTFAGLPALAIVAALEESFVTFANDELRPPVPYVYTPPQVPPAEPAPEDPVE